MIECYYHWCMYHDRKEPLCQLMECKVGGQGKDNVEIASIFNVSSAAIDNVVARRTYTHVDPKANLFLRFRVR